MFISFHGNWHLQSLLCKKKPTRTPLFPLPRIWKASSPAAIAGASVAHVDVDYSQSTPSKTWRLMKWSMVAMENKKSPWDKNSMFWKKNTSKKYGDRPSYHQSARSIVVGFFFSKLKMKIGIMENGFFNMLENSSTLCWRPSISELNPWKMLIERIDPLQSGKMFLLQKLMP